MEEDFSMGINKRKTKLMIFNENTVGKTRIQLKEEIIQKSWFDFICRHVTFSTQNANRNYHNNMFHVAVPFVCSD